MRKLPAVRAAQMRSAPLRLAPLSVEDAAQLSMRLKALAGPARWLVSNGRFGSALGSAFGPCGLLDWSDRLGCVPLARWCWDSAPGRREWTALFTLVRQAPPILWLSGAGRGRPGGRG